jgi:cell division protein FtsB
MPKHQRHLTEQRAAMAADLRTLVASVATLQGEVRALRDELDIVHDTIRTFTDGWEIVSRSDESSRTQ